MNPIPEFDKKQVKQYPFAMKTIFTILCVALLSSTSHATSSVKWPISKELSIVLTSQPYLDAIQKLRKEAKMDSRTQKNELFLSSYEEVELEQQETRSTGIYLRLWFDMPNNVRPGFISPYLIDAKLEYNEEKSILECVKATLKKIPTPAL